MAPHDCIVIGTGGVGSAALYHLAQRGVRALGLDRFPPGHDRGSSHGETRVIRLAYLEHPNYVPLLRRAYELWAELSERCEQQLYHETGFLQIGPADGPAVRGALASAQEHGLEVKEFSANEVERHFRGFRVPESMRAVLDPRAGYLRVEACVRAYANEAVKLGAQVRSGETVRSWDVDGSGVVVNTDHGRYTADCLIVTPGAWAADVLGDLDIRFEVRRKSLFWYEANDPAYAAENGCPVFFYDTSEGSFYGCPKIDHLGLKVGEHSGGQLVSEPLSVNRDVDPQDQQRVENFLQAYLPGVTHKRQRHVVCLYTMSPDERFVVDRHPRSPRVAFAAGLSGHGFKFASVLGQALTEIALDGRTTLSVDFLSYDRFLRHGSDRR